MRVLVAGANGVLGRRLVPRLIDAGHEVAGTSRKSSGAAAIGAMGATGFVADAFAAESLRAAIAAFEPEAVIDEMTSLPKRIRPRSIGRDFAENDRLRREGTSNLLDAARAGGVTTILAQSIAFAYAPGPPGTVHGEDDPLNLDAPGAFARSVAALAVLEGAVRDAGGTVLRYGYLYGPGTAAAADGSIGVDLARRRLPIIGDGAGVWSLLHVDDAAAATVLALDGPPGTYNIVDEHPAAVAEWLPALAAAIGAPRPLTVPVWAARPIAGSYGVATMTTLQGASCERARRELSFRPRFPDWRDGFREGLEDGR